MVNLPLSAAAILLAAWLALAGAAPAADRSGTPRIFDVGVSVGDGGLTVRLPGVVLTSSR